MTVTKLLSYVRINSDYSLGSTWNNLHKRNNAYLALFPRYLGSVLIVFNMSGTSFECQNVTVAFSWQHNIFVTRFITYGDKHKYSCFVAAHCGYRRPKILYLITVCPCAFYRQLTIRIFRWKIRRFCHLYAVWTPYGRCP